MYHSKQQTPNLNDMATLTAPKTETATARYAFDLANKLAPAENRYFAYTASRLIYIYDREAKGDVMVDSYRVYCKAMHKTRKAFNGYPEPVPGYDGVGMADRKAAAMNKAANK